MPGSDWGSVYSGNQIQYSKQALTNISKDIANRLEHQQGGGGEKCSKKTLLLKINKKLLKMKKDDLEKLLQEINNKKYSI